MTKLLLVANDVVGPQMAGPGIRYYEFARVLSKHFDVTLVVPGDPQLELDGVRVRPVGRYGTSGFLKFARAHDVVVAQTLRPWTMQLLARSETRVIYDLYDPFLIENLALFAGNQATGHERRLGYRGPHLLQEIALATGNSFICASDRQRDLWLGLLAALDRIDPHQYEQDPTLRDLIDVVPFGLPTEPPDATEGALKGVLPGIRREDNVLLWGGGIWNWFDPLTVIRAVHELSRRRDDVKLFFLGARRPNPIVPEMQMATRALELSKELGIYERHVFFNFGWVPYALRARYLLDADVGISSHFASIETRFSFRTRLLDYFWAGLPTIATKGDTLGDLVSERNLGRVVDAEDVRGWVDAIEELLDDRVEYEQMQSNLGPIRAEFAWPRVVEPLVRLASLPPSSVSGSKRVASNMLEYVSLHSRGLLARRGLVHGIAEGLGVLRNPRVP